MELKYSVGVKYGDNHKHFNTVSIHINGDSAKDILTPFGPVIAEWQNEALAKAKEKFTPKKIGKKHIGEISECRLQSINLKHEYGETLDVCLECGKTITYGDECPDCGVTF